MYMCVYGLIEYCHLITWPLICILCVFLNSFKTVKEETAKEVQDAKNTGLSEQQRKYADELINRYATEYEKNRAKEGASSSEDQQTPASDTTSKEPDVNDIIHKYSEQWSEQRLSKVAGQVNIAPINDQDANHSCSKLESDTLESPTEGQSNVPAVETGDGDSLDVNEIIKKYNCEWESRQKGNPPEA